MLGQEAYAIYRLDFEVGSKVVEIPKQELPRK
jgi:hypothetical protein